jgi:hypothetical protein
LGIVLVAASAIGSKNHSVMTEQPVERRVEHNRNEEI